MIFVSIYCLFLGVVFNVLMATYRKPDYRPEWFGICYRVFFACFGYNLFSCSFNFIGTFSKMKGHAKNGKH